MLKNVITKLLNSYLGAFVEDFGEIDYSTWSGEVSLQDVNIKKDALKSLSIPLNIKKGVIGKIHLVFDWKSLTTKPVQFNLSDISLHVEDNSFISNGGNFDANKNDQSDQSDQNNDVKSLFEKILQKKKDK